MIDKEPEIAFPYKAPSAEVKEKYAHIFKIENPLETRFLKLLCDKIIGASFLLAASPILLLLKIAYIVEGLLDRSAKGDLIYYYNASSAGRTIRKYKVRVIKKECIDTANYDEHDWHAYQNEWNSECRTVVGAFVKKFYLDELPQFWSIMKGDMSLIGPRPLALHHYERDFAQGNVSRYLLRGGLLGLGHIRKGTVEMGDPVFEYEYIDAYLHYSAFALLKLDLWILYKGLVVVVKGKGL